MNSDCGCGDCKPGEAHPISKRLAICSDISAVPSIAKKLDPHFANKVMRNIYRETFWRWLSEGKLHAASRVFKSLLS